MARYPVAARVPEVQASVVPYSARLHLEALALVS